MKKRIFVLFMCLVCFLVPAFSACSSKKPTENAGNTGNTENTENTENTQNYTPRFDGMNISETSPLANREKASATVRLAVPASVTAAKAVSGVNGSRAAETSDDGEEEPEVDKTADKAQDESDKVTDVPEDNKAQVKPDEVIDVPEDDLPSTNETPVDITEEIISELEKKDDIGVDESNASASFYAEINQDVYLSISIINPNSYSILRFTLNGVVYQSYQFESGSSSTLLVLKVNSGSVCGYKEFTLDEIKYVDDSDGNAIKDVIIEGNRSVKLAVAYDKVPSVEAISESMDYTKYSANFYVSDYYDLVNYEGGCRLYLYDGVEKKSEQNLKKGSNLVTFDNLVMGKTYKCVAVGLYDRYDGEGYSAHVLYETSIKPSAFCSFTEVNSSYDEITFGYKIYNSIAEVTDIILFNESGIAVARTDGKSFSNLYADTNYQLRIYYTFKIENEQYVFYDSFDVKTKAYPVPSVSATYYIRETAIDFDVHIDDDYNLLDLKAIKLYDQNGEFVATAQPDAKVIDGLARNKNYVLKLLYTYDLKNGKGEVEAEKVIAFSTSKAVPVVEIKPFLATETSLQFDLLVTDPNVVGRINSIRLFKKAGNIYVNALTNTALREFTSLTPNTQYVVEVGYIYDMDDGNGSQIVTYSEEMTTAKRVPVYGMDVSATTESLTITVNENDPDNAGSLTSVCVYDGTTLVKKIEDISKLMTVDGLYSDREYTVVGEYKYNVNDYSQTDTVKEIKAVASTYAKTAPQIALSDSGATYSSFNYSVRVEDTFKICAVENVKLMRGTVEEKQTTDLSGIFDGLYSNSKYTVEVYYSYDLNDGAGVHAEVYRKDVKTAKRDDIVVNYADMRALETSIKFGYDIIDADKLMQITKIELFDANGELVQSLEDLALRVFEGLETESFYTLVTTYQYDLNDGNGVQMDSASIKYGTSGSKLYVNSLSVINNNTPSVGEEVQVRLSLENPHGLDVTAIYISDVRCEVLNNSSDLSDVIVKFIPETDGGHYTVEVTGYEYVTGGITLADDLTSEYKQDILVMGELKILDYFAISDSYYLNFSKTPMRILEIYNPTGYEIYSLTYVSSPGSSTSNRYGETTDFTVIDENHLLIKEMGIELYYYDEFGYYNRYLTLCGITYGIEGMRVTATFDFIDSAIMPYYGEVHLSTADDLLSIGENGSTYYVLDNDIDMMGVIWSGVRGVGLFNGNGHTISNLTIVIEDEGTTTEYYGLFKSFTGVIHDLHLKDIYYSIKTNSSEIYVGGISASGGKVYDSSVSGTIRVQANGGYVIGLANGGERCVSKNNYVENLQIFVPNGVAAGLLNYSNIEHIYDMGNNRSDSYACSIGELNSMILGKSFVQNTDTNARTYPYYVGDTSGLGEMYVEKEVHNVEYKFVTNCDTVADFTETGVSVTSINVRREGYTVAWYDNPDFSGKEIVLPYMAEENTTLYAKWTRMTVADPRYTYEENWIYNSETHSSYKTYIIRNFGEAEKTDKTFVIGGYYKGYPVVGFSYYAFDFIRYKEVEGNKVERDWSEINALCKQYSVYITSTVYADNLHQIYAANVYMESIPATSDKNNSFNLSFYGETKLTVAEENLSFYKEKYKWSSITINSFTAANSPFKDVVTPAATDEKNDGITVICADAANLKESTKYQLTEFPYNYYEKDGYRWLDYNGTQFVIIDRNLYAGIESIVEDNLFRYIIYTNGDITIDALLAPTTATVDLTTLPYTITAIGDGVFSNSKIKNITLNEGLREIGSNAFYNCYNLTAIIYPSTLQSVGSYAFYNCRALQKIVMNDGINKIEAGTFYNNSGSSNLKEIVWSQNLKEIGWNAFYGYQSRIDFILPEGLEKISEYAFYNCAINIYIPSSVKTIDYGGVDIYDSSCTIFVAAEKKLSGWSTNWCNNSNPIIYWNVKEIKSNENYNYLVTNDNEVIILKCMNSNINTVEFDFEEGPVVEIADYAFSYVNLTELTLPESLKVIGRYAFNNSGLKYVLLPAGVEEIGEYAFNGNTAIYSKANVAAGGWDEDIAGRTVFGCFGVEQNEDFVYVKEINGIHIVGLTKSYVKLEVNFSIEGETTLSIAGRLFYENKIITSVVIPEGVEEIGANAFDHCSNLQSVTLPSTLKVIDNSAFYYCSNLQSLEIPESVTDIGAYAFYYCSNLQSLEIPESVTDIGTYAFYGCYNGKLVVYLTKNLTSVGYAAFENTGSMIVACEMPQKPEGWSESWFNGNSYFNIVNSRLYWDIAEAHIDGTEDYNYLVTNSGKIIILGANDTSITEIDFDYFDGDVVEIGYYAFSNCYNLKSVVLPETVTTIRAGAFNYYYIRFVYVPSSVVKVGANAFYSSNVVLTNRSEYVEGWDASVWTKDNIVKSVTDYHIEQEGYYKYLYYTVAGDDEEIRVSIN